MPDRFTIAPCPVADVLSLCEALPCSPALAQVLVRRGLADPQEARRFLAADDRHDPAHFSGMAEAVALIVRHVAAGSTITVHGDYDVDGICSTSILVRALRRCGAARADWFLPSRTEDGYGLSASTVERLHDRGTQLLITADCAVTAVEEVAAARALGMDVVVTDHHAARADGVLPDAPLVHPTLGGYPCAELCAGAVAYKLALALGRAHGLPDALAEQDLDLVALSTVADCVSLTGENRRLVREGLLALACTGKPGLRALMRVARVDPGAVDATAIGFRLAPRLNAAGRMQRADAGVELVLTEDEARAEAIAEELDRLNVDRRHTEERIRFEAEALVAVAGEQAAYVLSGDGWHPGVIGIVASRIAERHHRPVVVVAFADGAEQGTGSGRSIPAFDLLGGLDACAPHLLRHGGHRAAAGCTVRRDELEAFRAALVAHAEATLRPEDLLKRPRVDAIVSGGELGLPLAEELGQLAPFGIGNPSPALLVPAARLIDPRPMGEGKHIRFTVESGGARASAVAFGTAKLPEGAETGIDATFGLELNEWGGSISPRLVLRGTAACDPQAPVRVGEPTRWRDAVLTELATPVRPYAALAPPARNQRRRVLDRVGLGLFGTIAVLAASGEDVLVVCADAHRRHEQLVGRIGGMRLTSWRAVEREPGLLTESPGHLVALDPPPHPALRALLEAGPPGTVACLAWGEPELRFSKHVHDEQHALRDHLAAAYRLLRQAPGDVEGGLPRCAVAAGRVLAVLEELELISFDREAFTVVVPAPAARTELERSATFRACIERRAEGERWLRSPRPLAA